MSDVQAREWDLPPANHDEHDSEVLAPAPEPVAEVPAPVSVVEMPAEPVAPANDAPEPADPRRDQFFAGAGVRFKGELEGSDELLLSGTFEGTAKARRLVVSREGRFNGTCVVDEAEIEGVAEGTLTVTGALIVRAGGVVRGKVSYGEIELERGAHLEGEVVKKLAQAAPVVDPVPVELSVADIVVVPAPRVLTQDAEPSSRRRFGIFGARR